MRCLFMPPVYQASQKGRPSLCSHRVSYTIPWYKPLPGELGTGILWPHCPLYIMQTLFFVPAGVAIQKMSILRIADSKPPCYLSTSCLVVRASHLSFTKVHAIWTSFCTLFLSPEMDTIYNLGTVIYSKPGKHRHQIHRDSIVPQ